MMENDILNSARPVTLIGGGDVTASDLHKALTLAPLCVAADGGAAFALRENIDLAAVIGDFDSLDPAILAKIPAARQHRIVEQVSTDFEKALSRIAAPVVVGVGFTGGRVDHQLAAMHTLLSLPARPCVLIAQHEIIFLAPPLLELSTEKGDVVSLFPMGPATGRSSGLEWPIDGIEFAPAGMIGTSNRATGPVRIEMDTPTMLTILPRRLIQPVVQSLARPDRVRWPVRAVPHRAPPPS